MGVEAGVLAAVLLVCLVLIGFFLYRLIALPKRATAIELSSTTVFKRARGVRREFYVISLVMRAVSDCTREIICLRNEPKC